ncbi:MAG TPA: protein kinase family protein [Gemmatimonadaceae bacterium]
MAYEMLAGQPPFANRTPHRLMAAHMAEPPRPVQELRADTSPALAALVMRCLEKDAAARPQSAAEVLASLDAMSTSDPGRAAMPAALLGGPRMFWKALGVYAVAFIAVAVLAQAAIVGIGLPGWVFPGAFIVMALGLPVILFTAHRQRVLRRTVTQSPSFTPGGTPSLPTNGTMAALAIRASPHVSWRKTMLGGVWAVAVFAVLVGGFMLLRALGMGPAGSLLAAGTFSAKAPVLITDFATANTDSSLGPVVSDAVRAGLGQSKIISLMAPALIASTLKLMGRPATTRVDLPVAREVAQREGVQAIVDGGVTGVPGGYILTLRLVTADSGVELAPFRETADGPRGLIDAADKIARALREKIGESLREVQATPPLARETTSSLQALRLFNAGTRFTNMAGELQQGVASDRQAVAVDSTFAQAWSNLALGLVNLGASQASIDSALEHAYRLRVRLPDRERLNIEGAYYELGSHRDRLRAIEIYKEETRLPGAGLAPALGNMGEVLRTMRLYARAESLDVRGLQIDSDRAIAAVNVIELELDRGGVDSAAAMYGIMHRRHPASPVLAVQTPFITYARGDLGGTRRLADSLAGTSNDVARSYGLAYGADLSLIQGQLGRAAQQYAQAGGDAVASLVDSLTLITASTWFRNTNAGAAARIAGTLARYPFTTMALADRPYFAVATAWARIGKPDRAEATIAAYRSAVTDTAMLRVQGAALHTALGEIALAEHHADRALSEFRQGDTAYDQRPATECAPCLPLELARAFDAAGQADSAIAQYETFIATPYYNRLVEVDPLALALAHERLGELYEARGDAARAAARDQRFIALWANADADLQPRVAQARQRLAALGAHEGSQ